MARLPEAAAQRDLDHRKLHILKAGPKSDLLRVTARGLTYRQGSRQHGDKTSPRFREHSRRITRAMAKHYRDNPASIGWQTDDEPNTFYLETVSRAAARALRRHRCAQRRRAPASGHRATAISSRSNCLRDSTGRVQPEPRPDRHRFLAYATAMFQCDQVEILRAANPNWFVTQNIGAIRDLDRHGPPASDIDFLGYDIHPFSSTSAFAAAMPTCAPSSST